MNRPIKPTDLRDTVTFHMCRTVTSKAYDRINAINASRAEPTTEDEVHCWAAGFIQGYLLRRAERQKRRVR